MANVFSIFIRLPLQISCESLTIKTKVYIGKKCAQGKIGVPIEYVVTLVPYISHVAHQKPRGTNHFNV